MLYTPAATPPVVVQDNQQQTAPLQSTSRYYMLQSAPAIPAVPLMNTTFVYPRYGFVPKPVETSVTKESIESSQPQQIYQIAQPVQHVVHHYTTCPGYCSLCTPWIDQHVFHSKAITNQQRAVSQDELNKTEETIDEKIERIRRELRQSSTSSPPPPIVEHHIHPRPRSSSATRDPWRSSSQNNYPWRDSHLPAYRDATLARSQTSLDQTRTFNEPKTAHERSHQNTQHPTTYYSKKDYVYRPRSEVEAKKWYTQTTGKDADREVHQALRGGTTTYQYTGSSTPFYNKQQSTSYTDTSNTKTHSLRKIDSTQNHNLYACNEPCLHIVPKQGSTQDPPYMKILNAPVTYLH